MGNNLSKIIAISSFLGLIGVLLVCLVFYKTTKIDETMCISIADEIEKDKCFYDLALIKNDTSFCDKAGDWKEVCYKEIKGETGKPDLYIEQILFYPTR